MCVDPQEANEVVKGWWTQKMPIRESGDLELWSKNQNKEFYLQNTEDFSGACMPAISKHFFFLELAKISMQV